MNINRKLIQATALVVMAGTLFLGVAASPAGAGTTGVKGRIGNYSVAPVTCRHTIRGQAQSLVIAAPAPRVLAANRHSGSGNDAQWVRYRVVLRDYRTMGILSSTGWSGWASVNDNRVSTWNGSTVWNVDALGGRMYRVDYVVEWYSGNTRVGVATHHADRVDYISYSQVRYTGLQACWRYR